MHAYTAESVAEGQPDKICDQISVQILDEILMQEPNAGVAVETVVTSGLVHIPEVVRAKLVDISYTTSEIWFDGRAVACRDRLAIAP